MRNWVSPEFLEGVRIYNHAYRAFEASLLAGCVPWCRSATLGYACGLPRDEDGNSYTGMTRWLLEAEALRIGFAGSRWKRDEGGMVVMVEPAKDTPFDRKKHLAPFKAFREVILSPDTTPEPRRSPDYEAAMSFVRGTGAIIKWAESAYYLLRKNGYDYICLPDLCQFEEHPEEYWREMFHELIHWATFGMSRLAWDGEELLGEIVAEMGASILVDRFGIPMLQTQQDKHLKRWTELFDTREAEFWTASDLAERAVDFLLNHKGIRNVRYQGFVLADRHQPVLPVHALCDSGQPEALSQAPVLEGA